MVWGVVDTSQNQKTMKIIGFRVFKKLNPKDTKPKWSRIILCRRSRNTVFHLRPGLQNCNIFPTNSGTSLVHLASNSIQKASEIVLESNSWKSLRSFCSGSGFGSFLDVLWAGSSCLWNVMVIKRSRFSWVSNPGLAKSNTSPGLGATVYRAFSDRDPRAIQETTTLWHAPRRSGRSNIFEKWFCCFLQIFEVS